MNSWPVRNRILEATRDTMLHTLLFFGVFSVCVTRVCLTRLFRKIGSPFGGNSVLSIVYTLDSLDTFCESIEEVMQIALNCDGLVAETLTGYNWAIKSVFIFLIRTFSEKNNQ